MSSNFRLGWTGGEEGSVLLESAFGVALILAVAIPFASLASYATYAARDLAAAQGAARDAARNAGASPGDPSIVLTCGPAAASATAPCTAPLTRATYVAAARDTVVLLPFGLSLHTNARGVARVE